MTLSQVFFLATIGLILSGGNIDYAVASMVQFSGEARLHKRLPIFIYAGEALCFYVVLPPMACSKCLHPPSEPLAAVSAIEF